MIFLILRRNFEMLFLEFFLFSPSQKRQEKWIPIRKDILSKNSPEEKQTKTRHSIKEPIP